jgi:hypothetical protein
LKGLARVASSAWLYRSKNPSASPRANAIQRLMARLDGCVKVIGCSHSRHLPVVVAPRHNAIGRRRVRSTDGAPHCAIAIPGTSGDPTRGLDLARLAHPQVIDLSVDQTVGTEDLLSACRVYGQRALGGEPVHPLLCGETSLGSDQVPSCCSPNSGLAASSPPGACGGPSPRICFFTIARAASTAGT